MKRLLRYQVRPWRIGRRVGRTIYAVIGDQADDHDPLIGVMDTRALAEAAVRAHNTELQGVTVNGAFDPDKVAEKLRDLMMIRRPRE